MQTKKQIGLAVLVVPLLCLPGCGLVDWFKTKFGGSSSTSGMLITDQPVAAGDVVLATIDGKPLITLSTFNRDFELLLEEQPQLRQVLQFMPDAKQNFLAGMISQAIVDQAVKDSKLDQSEAYKKDRENMMRAVERMLNTKHFGQQHPVTISDSKVKEFYEKHKADMPDLLISRGGVKAMGVSFASEADAKAFLAKVKGKDFAKTAAESGLKDKVSDFKLVNEQSIGMDPALRAKLVSIKKYPTVELAKDADGKFWVVIATGSEEAKYRPFEQVKEPLKQFVEKQERMESFDKEIEKLKSKYNVKVNEEYFKAKQQDQPESPLGLPDLQSQRAEPAAQPRASRAA